MSAPFSIHFSVDRFTANYSEFNSYAKVYLFNPANSELEQLGETEIAHNSVSPLWAKTTRLDYSFEKLQNIVVRVFNSADKETIAPGDFYLGEAKFSFASLLRARGQRLSLGITHYTQTEPIGNLIVTAEEVVDISEGKEIVSAHISASGLPAESFFIKPNTYLTASRVNEGSTWSVVWRSQTVSNSTTPNYGTMSISLSDLCNADLDREIKFSLWEFKEDGQHEEKGFATVIAGEIILTGKGNLELALKDKSTKAKIGQLMLSESRMEVPSVAPSFVKYVEGGCEMSLVVAVDFTGSNGEPTDPVSLHYIDPAGRLNDYQSAISSVGKILEEYDSDKKYPVFGYGASFKLPNGERTKTSWCFPLTVGGKEVDGVEGILKAYNDVLPKLVLRGPTNFKHIIRKAADIARELRCSQENQKYCILLILTDGRIDDLEESIDAIVDASQLPLSIIIVGVGNDKFDKMDKLDSDDKLLESGSKTAARDIVQFVPYKKFKNSKEKLAEEVLAEIPDQFLGYMREKGIVPNGTGK